MKKRILYFLKRILFFLAPLLILPLTVFLTDPFDYFGHEIRLNLDRIHTVRVSNIADWALVEASKIDSTSKSRCNVVSIGDSRGRALMSKGYELGWKGRITGVALKHYDLSFGGADVVESISLLNKELQYLDSLKTIIVILPIDKILTYNRASKNRIESSQFNSNTPAINYLLNLRQLTYLFNPKRLGQSITLELSVQKDIKKYFLEIYDRSTKQKFDDNLLDIMLSLSKLNSKYNIKIVIPACENSLFEEIITHHKKDYEYYLDRISNSMLEDSIRIIKLQSLDNKFYFTDPIHGFFKTESSHLESITKQP